MKKKKQKNNKIKRRPPEPRAGLRKALSAYFAAQILCAAAYAVFAGASFARRGSERVLGGAPPAAVTVEDLNKWGADIASRLVHFLQNLPIDDLF